MEYYDKSNNYYILLSGEVNEYVPKLELETLTDEQKQKQYFKKPSNKSFKSFK